MRRPLLLLLLALGALCCAQRVRVDDQAQTLRWEAPCSAKNRGDRQGSDKCLPVDNCARVVLDGLFPQEDIRTLHDIALKGMSLRENPGGPTILDINTGFLRDSNGMTNIYKAPHNLLFEQHEFETYKRIQLTLRETIRREFGIDELFFTAPTFITRLTGGSWEPAEMHDEYWHLHVDKNNTPHYDYSGLLYMSDYGKDFQGGLLTFLDAETESVTEQVIEPRAGRAIIFTSGPENPHYVDRVTQGDRLVLAFWFTCNPKRYFAPFLDGKAHVKFQRHDRESEQEL